ncbi:MAG: maleylpyruvate isomerase family mycothiol-dependent enzyme [Candidatus Dormibacter sp.]
MEAKGTRLAQAADWYLAAVDAVPADGWDRPTLCEGWTAQHVVAHVATGDQLVRGLLLRGTGKDTTDDDVPVDFADRQRRMQDALTWQPAELKDKAHLESGRTVALIAETAEKAPDTIITMPFGVSPMPVLRALRLNEYLIHGHDLSPAIGRSQPIPDWFIDRGLSETVTLMQRLHLRSPHKGKSATFHIHRTDGEGEWVLRADGGQAVMEPGHAKADVALRGPGEGLYWVLMGRGQPEDNGVEFHGDPVLATAFKEWFPGP